MLAARNYFTKPAPSSVAFFNRGEGLYQTGGYLYNQYVREALTDAGLDLKVHEQPGDLDNINASCTIIIDSLMMSELAPIIVRKNLSPILLYHLPPDLSDLSEATNNMVRKAEKQSLIIVTGDVSYAHMRKRFVNEQVELYKIEPGVPDDWRRKTRNVIAKARLPKKLLMIASYQPGKGLETLPDILPAITSDAWTLDVIGESAFCPDFKSNLQKQLTRSGLQEKVRLHGPKNHQDINQAMLDADLLLQLSPFETYSMVTAEAIAADLPVLSTPTGNQHSFSRSGKVKYTVSSDKIDIITELNRLMQELSVWQSLCEPDFGTPRTWKDVKQNFLQVITNELQGSTHLTTGSH